MATIPRSLRRLSVLGAIALLSLSIACRLDMLLKAKNTPRPVLSVAPTEVRDSARAGSHDVRHTNVQITNTGEGTFTWSASDHAAWIQLDPTKGEIPGTLTIALNPEDLNPGVYQGDVTVMAVEAADTQFTTIAVTFLVQRPGLSIAPATIERSTNVNSNAIFTETVQVTNSGTGQLSWSASENRSWMSLGASSGTGNGSIPVTINTSGLAAGTYHGDIVVTAPGAIGSPASVSVTVTILAPGLAVTPGVIRETATPGSTAAKTDTLRIRNTGNGTLTWTATKMQPWLSLSKAAGGAPDSLTVMLNPTGLPAGMQKDTIVFTSPEAINGSVKVPVEYVIVQPGLAVSPPSITATAQQNDTKKQRFTLSVSNSAAGPLLWTAAADQPWIAVSPTGGLAPSTLSVDLDPQGLAAGTHTSTVTVASPGAAGSPFTVPVQLTIVSKPCAEIAVAPDVINRAGTLDANDCNAPHRPASLANIYGFNANAGDTISIHLVSTQFDAYLILTDGAGNVLAQNDECPGETGNACIKDFRIPASGHYLVEATSVQPGAVGQLSFSLVRERPPTPPQGLGQFRANSTTTIGVGDATPETEVVFKGKVDDPNDADLVRLEIELEPLGSPFTGVATHASDFVSAIGAGSQTSVRASGLTNNTGYRWQARTCDNTGRCSVWLQFGNNAETAADFTVVTP
jgi:BACON domain-containing protein/pre-peptidase